MIIQNIYLKQFGRFAEFQVSFTPGLNIIKGPNEAGKSTLHQALLMSLFESPSKKKANRRYRQWGQNDWYELSVEFTEDHQCWRIEKDFNRFRQHITDPDGATSDDRQRILDVIGQTLGTKSLPVFRSTVCVAQDAITSMNDGRQEIARSLEEIITGGDEHIYTQSTLQKLDDQIRTYRRGYFTNAPKNPGPIKQLLNEQEIWQKRATELRQQLDRVETDEGQIHASKKQLESIESDIKHWQTLYAAVEQNMQLQKDLESWQHTESELETQLKNITNAEQEIDSAANTLAQLGAVEHLNQETYKSIGSLQERVALLEEAGGKRPLSDETAVIQKRTMPTRQLILGGVVALIGFIALLVGIFTLTTGSNAVLSTLSFGGGLLALLGGLGWIGLQYLRANSQTQPVIKSTPAIDQTALADEQQQLAAQLEAINCNSWAELEEKWNKRQQANLQIETGKATLKALLPGDKSKAELEDARKEASRKRRDLQEQLDEPRMQKAAEISAPEYEEMRSRIEDLQQKEKSLNEQSLKSKGRLEKTAVSHEELLQAEEHLESITADLERAKERLDVYECAYRLMKTARENTLKRAQSLLEPHIANYLDVLTLGRYQSVRVDSELNITVKDPNSLKYISPSDLSKGAQDQVYMAARLALVKLIFRNTKPPLFLDDPFVKFDHQRLQAAIRLCQDISKQRQLFLFTCSNNYDGIGNLIELNGHAVF